MTISALDCKPHGIDLRDIQVAYAKWIEENWENYDVFVPRCDVGSGKSIMAILSANFIAKNDLGRTSIVVPNRMLQDQYQQDFEYIPLLKGMANYKCDAVDKGTCKDTKTHTGECCKNGCAYMSARNVAQTAQTAIFNTAVYYHAKMWKSVLIMDEAHNAAPTIYSMFGMSIWKCEENYPDDMTVEPESVAKFFISKIIELAESQQEALANLNNELVEKIEEKIQNYQNVLQMLQTEDKKNIIIKKKKDKYFGQKRDFRNTEQEYFFIKPINIKSLAEKVLWPSSAVKKIIMFSATINEQEIKVDGLDDRKVGYFTHPSPIPPDKRPFIYHPIVNMSYKKRQESYPMLVAGIQKIADLNPNDKGLVHCTYDTATKLKHSLGVNGRFLFHDNKNKMEVYKYFRSCKSPAILIASGMSEGIDLPDDLARFQVLTQVMNPSLADEVNVWRLANAPDLYTWDTIKTILQQTGRVCRGANDYGKTYMIDSQFGFLFYKAHTARIEMGLPSMIPDSFLESIIWPKEKK